MIRSIAKFLIQYLYDSTLLAGHADRLPRWMRKWVNSDSQLRDFERELLRLESRLISQAEGHIAGGVPPSGSDSTFVRTNEESQLLWRSPLALAALAAGLACVLLAGRWLSMPSTSEPIHPNLTPSDVPGTLTRLSDGERKAILLRSTWNATRQLAMRLDQKSHEAANAIAIANQKVRDESKWIQSVGHDGLKFFAQELPAASVRMMGFNSAGH